MAVSKQAIELSGRTSRDREAAASQSIRMRITPEHDVSWTFGAVIPWWRLRVAGRLAR